MFRKIGNRGYLKTHMLFKNKKTLMLPNHDETLLNGILESLLDFIKARQSKKGNPDLDNMLYIHVLNNFLGQMIVHYIFQF